MRDVTPAGRGIGDILVPGLLFVVTFLTTTIAGALQQGAHPFRDPASLARGLPFSLTLMAILLGHEMAHFAASRLHRVPSSLPYFIPAPTPVGTFGAVIRMKGVIWDRPSLLDIGASGPLAGFFLSLPALAWGMAHSAVLPGPAGGGGVSLGGSLIVALMEKLMLGSLPPDAVILIHPVGLAGWFGLFVTSLNLLPVGQLDGGHVLHALLPRLSPFLARAAHITLFLLGIIFWSGWLVWALLLVVLGVTHPPVAQPQVPLDPARRRLGWAALLLLALTFVPTPIQIP